MKSLIPADTVDARGTVWETTGENIRHGEKSFSENDVKEIINILFPVESVYCGENSLVLSVGKWDRLSLNGIPIISSSTAISGNSIPCDYIVQQENSVLGLSMRMWRRVE